MTTPQEDEQVLITHRKVLYILKTHVTLPSDADEDETYAWMITNHIHKNFVSKDAVREALGKNEREFNLPEPDLPAMCRNRMRENIRQRLNIEERTEL